MDNYNKIAIEVQMILYYFLKKRYGDENNFMVTKYFFMRFTEKVCNKLK